MLRKIFSTEHYINNSLHLARKYAQIFVRGHYLFREANSFPRAKLEENCELRGADNVQGQISEHIFKVKWRLLCLLSFKYFSQHAGISRESAGSAILSYVNHVKVCQLASKISTSDFASGQKRLFGKTFERKVNLFNSVKDKSKIQVADKVTGNLTTSREQAKDH